LRSHDWHWFVFLLRRILTVAIALALLAFSFTYLVLKPVQEVGMMPQKIYTTPAYTRFANNIVDENWSIVAQAVSKIPGISNPIKTDRVISGGGGGDWNASRTSPTIVIPK
jgi:hypothetical protein